MYCHSKIWCEWKTCEGWGKKKRKETLENISKKKCALRGTKAGIGVGCNGMSTKKSVKWVHVSTKSIRISF